VRGPVEALLGFGVLSVVPVGLSLQRDVRRRWVGWAIPVAILASFSLQSAHPVTAVVVAVPWLVLTVSLAALSGWRWLTGGRPLRDIAWPASLAYLTVGAVWLLAHALRIEPAGVRPLFVLLTSVHFHFAGFVATLLSARVRERCAGAAPRLTDLMLGAVVIAPPIVAAGFTLFGPLQVVGAVVLTGGLFILAWLTVRHAIRGVSADLGKVLLVISSLSVLVPMVLAVQWAVGANFGTPALSISQMAMTHGIANAVGFAGCGVWGWWLARAGDDKLRPAA